MGTVNDDMDMDDDDFTDMIEASGDWDPLAAPMPEVVKWLRLGLERAALTVQHVWQDHLSEEDDGDGASDTVIMEMGLLVEALKSWQAVFAHRCMSQEERIAAATRRFQQQYGLLVDEMAEFTTPDGNYIYRIRGTDVEVPDGLEGLGEIVRGVEDGE